MRKLKLEELNRISVNEFKSQDKIPLIVVLENIRSLNNIGAIFRTSDAFKVEAIYLVGITATPPHREIQKTALGATESIDWKYFETPEEAMASLKEGGYFIGSIEQAENSTTITDLDKLKFDKLAIVMGNEVEGVEQQTINDSDVCIEIPQYGTKHSLNVGVCAGIVIWEAFKILNKEG
jgi:tRNA G18 (ribose-2'-O)-methylase SpoU